MKLLGKEIRIFGKKKNVEVMPIIIMEETVSVSHKINKQRVNPGLKFESVDFFYSKKILYPASQDPDTVEILRGLARDTCWKQIHELELDFVHSEGTYTWETQWEKILASRRQEAEERAAREAEILQDQIDQEAIPELTEEEKSEIVQDAFPEEYKPDTMPASLEVRMKKEVKTRTIGKKGRFQETGTFGDDL